MNTNREELHRLDLALLESIRWAARIMSVVSERRRAEWNDPDVVMATAREAIHQLVEERGNKRSGNEIEGLKLELHNARLTIETLKTQLALDNAPTPHVLDGAFPYTLLDVDRIEAHRGRPYARLRATVMALNLCGDKIRKALDDVDSSPIDHLRQRVRDSLNGIVAVPPSVDAVPAAQPPNTIVVDVVAAASPSAEMDF